MKSLPTTDTTSSLQRLGPPLNLCLESPPASKAPAGKYEGPTMSLYAPRMAAVMIPRNRLITLSTTEAHRRRCRWMTSQQLPTPVNS